MANKEEVLIKVKADLAGFRKSMEQIKQIAMSNVKDIEKSMTIDLTSAGVKAGKTFVNGFNSQLKGVTNNINSSLKGSNSNVNIKVNADTSGLSSLSNLASASMVNSSAKAMKGSMNEVTVSISRTCNQIKELTSILNSDLLNGFKNVGDKSAVELESVSKRVRKVKTAYDEMFASLNNNANAPNMSNIKRDMEEASDSAEDLGDNVVQLKKYMEELNGAAGWGGGIQSVIDYIEEGLKDIDDSERKAKAAADDWKDTYDKVGVSMERIREEANLLKALDTFDNSQESGIAFLRVLKEIDDRYKGTLSSIKATDLGKILADKFDIPIDPSIFEGIGNNITKALKDIDRDADFSMVTGDIDHLASAFELGADRIRKAMQQIRMATGNSGGSFMTTALSNAEKQTTSVMANITKSIKDTAKSVTTSVGNIFSGLISTFTSLGRRLGTAVSAGFRLASGVLRTTGRFLASTLTAGFRAGYGLIKSAVSGVSNIITKGLHSAYNAASKISSKISSVLSKAINQQGSIDMNVDMGNYKSKAYSGLSGDAVMSSMNSLLSAMKATLPRQIASVFESVTLGLTGSFNKLSNTILLVSQSFTLIKGYAPKILSMITSLVNSAKPYIQSAMNLVGAYMKLHMNTTFAPLKAVFGELTNQCKAAGQAIVDMGHNTISSLKSTISIITSTFSNFGGSLELIKGSFDNFGGKLTSVGKFISDTFQNIMAYVQDNFGETILFVRDSFVELSKIFKSWLAAIKPLISTIITLLNTAAGLLRPLLPVLSSLLGLYYKLTEAINVFINRIVKIISTFAMKLQAPIKKFSDAVSGTINKMTSWVDGALGTVTGNKQAKDPEVRKKEIESELKDSEAYLEALKSESKPTNAKWYNPSSWAVPDNSGAIKMTEERIEALKKELAELNAMEIDTSIDIDDDDLEKKLKELEEKEIEIKPINIELDSADVKEVESQLDNIETKVPKFNIGKIKSLGSIPDSTAATSDYTVNTESAFDKLRNKAEQAADAIRNKLNSINTDVAQEEVEELTNDLEKAKQEFKDLFKIGGTGSAAKGISDIMEKISKYSDMLAKMKNPLLTVRTEQAKKSLADLTESAKKTKSAYDQFKAAGDNVKSVKMDANATAMDKFRASMEKTKATFNLLKASLSTGMKVRGFNDATAGLAKAEQDMEKLKAKMKSAFNSMFDGAKKVTKNGWDKLTSLFRKGASDCEKPVSSLKGVVSKLAGMFGLYQLGSIFVEGTKEAIKYEAALMNIQRTLGGASQTLIDFANNTAVAFGVSKRQVMDYGNIFSMIVSNFEGDAKKVASTTQALIESAGTIAAGTGRTVEEVLESLRSGILGSSEAVDQLGLNLKTASLAAAAGVDSWDKLSEAQKQAIITQEILNQTAARYGGITRNTASMQNAFSAQLANTKLALGNVGKAIWTAVLPALTQLMAILEKVFNFVATVMSAILGLFGIQVQFSGGGTGGAVEGLSDSLGGVSDAAGGASDALGGAGDSAKKAADDTKNAAKEIKRSLAG